MEKRELLYEAKAERVFATDDPSRIIQYVNDEVPRRPTAA